MTGLLQRVAARLAAHVPGRRRPAQRPVVVVDVRPDRAVRRYRPVIPPEQP